MGCNDIVLIGDSPDHSDKENVMIASENIPTSNLDENTSDAWVNVSRYITSARVEADAVMVPVSESVKMVDKRPDVVGHAGGTMYDTKQVILLLRRDVAVEKFK